ncbi:hypothetical protein IWW39_002764 [Coemansia spiralis]|uniref:Uncharacterized protein n=1 Tax=Coemansia spiralis TaxID=417178 RepID=A0A9W8GKL8_9FUNG|nr:hypothetical protein IWW39_002764 [Coemansia spiralis]
MSALYVPAEPRFAVHRSDAGDDGASFISVLVMTHSGEDKGNKPGMVWVWAQVTPGRRARASAMTNLVLAMPPSPHTRASSSQLMGSGAADDPTVDIGRRLTSRFKRPIFVSLNNVSTSRLTASAAAMGPSLALSMAQADELVALESCLVAELKMALPNA